MRRDERGFSLTEVLAAFLVLTIVITVSFAAFLERNNRLRQASEVTLAYQALANEAEFIRRVPFAELDTTTTFDESGRTILTPLTPFETKIGVVDVKTGVKRVTLTVQWKAGQREAKLAVIRAHTGGETLW